MRSSEVDNFVNENRTQNVQLLEWVKMTEVSEVASKIRKIFE